MTKYDLQNVVVFTIGLLLIYPAALLSQLLLDTFYGDGEFIRLFMYESKRRLLGILITDWIKSFVLVFPIYLMILLLIKKITSPILGVVLIPLSALFIILPLMLDIFPTMIGFIFSYIFLFLYIVRRITIV